MYIPQYKTSISNSFTHQTQKSSNKHKEHSKNADIAKIIPKKIRK